MRENFAAATFRAPRHFGRLPGHRTSGIVRRSWRRPAHLPGGARGWCCQCVEVETDNAWDEEAAPYILLEAEWRIWHRLSRASLRRRWVRGRVAAKDAVRLLALDRYQMAAPLETLCILPDERGQPKVSCAALPGAGVCLSISHCGNTSVALAAERSEFCCGVGIDVAAQMDDHDGLTEGGFASAEMSLLDDFPPPERNDWLLRLWCAKEAAGKALGVGLQGNPLNFAVSRIDRIRQTTEIESQVTSPLGERSADHMRMTAHVGCDQGMAFAVTRLEGI